MKKAELVPYTELKENKPSKHTTKLQEIILLSAYTGYDVWKKKNYTYYTYKTKENTFYPSANKDRLCYLDGMVGTINLTDLKREYTIVK